MHICTHTHTYLKIDVFTKRKACATYIPRHWSSHTKTLVFIYQDNCLYVPRRRDSSVSHIPSITDFPPFSI